MMMMTIKTIIETMAIDITYNHLADCQSNDSKQKLLSHLVDPAR